MSWYMKLVSIVCLFFSCRFALLILFVFVCLFVCLFWQSFRLKNYIAYLCSIYHFDSGLITKTRAVLNMIHVNIDMVIIVYMITTVEVRKFSIWSKFILRWTSWPNRWRKWWVFIHLRVLITLNSPCPNFSGNKTQEMQLFPLRRKLNYPRMIQKVNIF